MHPITARYRWTIEDLITVRKYAPTTKSDRLISIIIAITAGAIVIFQNFISPTAFHTNLEVFGIFLAAICVSLITLFLCRQFGALFVRRQFANLPNANQEIAWAFSEREITIVTPIAKSEVQWSVFPKVISTSKGYVFVSDNQACGFIPTRAFETPADIENLKTLARQHATDFKELN